jgi:hypothetical protein
MALVEKILPAKAQLDRIVRTPPESNVRAEIPRYGDGRKLINVVEGGVALEILVQVNDRPHVKLISRVVTGVELKCQCTAGRRTQALALEPGVPGS